MTDTSYNHELAPLNPWPWETPPPGIYFDMPFEQYLAIPCLSSTGLKNLLISGTDFWANCQWMNPLCDDIDDDSKAKIEGRAYHKRILEGKAAFYKEYAPDYEDDANDKTIIRSSDDIKKALAANGAKISFANKAEGARRLLDADPKAKILELMAIEHRGKYPGREFMPAKTIRYIELAAKMIECHSHLHTWLVGGYPEVSVIWDDPVLGVRLKVRFDFLKVGPPCDLKTFANQMKKETAKAINFAIASNKYHIQGALYLHGNDIAKHLAAKGMVYNAENIDPAWLRLYSQTPSDEFRYIFQQKGSAPLAKGRFFYRKEKAYAQGAALVTEACRKFKHYYGLYGTDPWIDDEAPQTLYFDDFPAFINDV